MMLKTMKINKIFIVCLLLLGFSLLSCSIDDDKLFSSDKYPLRIASVTVDDGNPVTRVSENDEGTGSIWTDGDTIAVNISGSGTGIYTLTSEGKIKSTVQDVYWKNDEAKTIYARYPAHSEYLDLDIGEQSKGLKYSLNATVNNVTYKDKVHLVLKNQFAKVRIKLTGSLASRVSQVVVRGFTLFSGGINYGQRLGRIYMMKKTYPDGEYFEANLVPQTIKINENFLQIDVGNGLRIYPIDSSVTELLAGHSYTFNVQVQDIWSEHVFHSDVGLISSDPGKISLVMNGTGILRIDGWIGQKDIDSLISKFSRELKYLDMSDVKISGDKPSMPENAFKNATNLISIRLPAFDNFKGDTFRGCSNLKSVYIADAGENSFNQNYLRSLLGDFKDCINLTSIKIPSSLFTIEEAAFENCTKLRTFVVPKYVKVIGGYSFAGCSSLTSVVLPLSLEAIDLYAFKDCINLKLIKCNARTPPYLDSRALENVPSDCVIKVPKGYLDAYTEADGWKDLKNLEEFNENIYE